MRALQFMRRRLLDPLAGMLPPPKPTPPKNWLMSTHGIDWLHGVTIDIETMFIGIIFVSDIINMFTGQLDPWT